MLTTTSSKPRYEFIDLMKGICILMVVMSHCQIAWISDFALLTTFRMPLYYILSGIFFKTYGSFNVFLNKKINSLIIPYLATVVLYNLVVNIIHYFTGGYKVLGFDPPSMWFLISLFQVGIIYYCIQQVKNTTAQTIICIVLSLIGYMLFYLKIELPFYTATTLSTVIFYHFGYIIKTANILKPKTPKHNIIMLIIFVSIFVIIGAVFTVGKLKLQRNIYPSNYLISIALALSGTLIILFLSKLLVKLPFISYIGRYSIIVLCTHNTYINLFTTLTEYWNIPYADYIVLLSVLLLSVPTIKIVNKYVPFLFAQKPFMEGIKATYIYKKINIASSK